MFHRMATPLFVRVPVTNIGGKRLAKIKVSGRYVFSIGVMVTVFMNKVVSNIFVIACFSDFSVLRRIYPLRAA